MDIPGRRTQNEGDADSPLAATGRRVLDACARFRFRSRRGQHPTARHANPASRARQRPAGPARSRPGCADRGFPADRCDRVAETAKRLPAGLQSRHLQRLEADDHHSAAIAVRAQPSRPVRGRGLHARARAAPGTLRPAHARLPRQRGRRLTRLPRRPVQLPRSRRPRVPRPGRRGAAAGRDLAAGVLGHRPGHRHQAAEPGHRAGAHAAHRRPRALHRRVPRKAPLRRLPARRPGHRVRPPLPDRRRQRRAR